MFGFLNVNKPKGMTSHDVVSVLRRITKIKQIGHTGTLDPFAEGVLPICIGKAARLIEYLNDDKAYIGIIQFGKSTSTYDIEGEIVNTSEKIVTENDIKFALRNFIGDIEQYPPMYSAIKINGKKLYEYARNGEKIEIKPRKVNIKFLKIINFKHETQQLELYIECSKGTYIRSIANDLGEKLGAYGHLINLTRVKAGDFIIENAVPLNNLENIADVEKQLVYPTDYLHYPKYETDSYEQEKISHGMPVKPKTDFSNGTVILTNNKKIIAIGEYNNGLIKTKKVFTNMH